MYTSVISLRRRTSTWSASRVGCAHFHVCQVQPNVHRGRKAIRYVALQVEQQLFTAVHKDGICRVACIALTLAGVWLQRVDLIGQRVIEEELRCELVVLPVSGPGADGEVDVYGPARIPARVDGQELDPAICIPGSYPDL